MIGTQVQQFKILEKIGEGGMGEVYLAEDTRLERKVALKFLPPHYSQDPDFKARFEHEAKAAAALNLTAEHLSELGLIDAIIAEPLGGAHKDFEQTAEALKTNLDEFLAELSKLKLDKLLDERFKRYRSVGSYRDLGAPREEPSLENSSEEESVSEDSASGDSGPPPATETVDE